MLSPLVGTGVYEVEEASHLLAVPLERVVRWTLADGRGLPPVVTPSLDDLFSFVDLVSLAVVAELCRRRVTEAELRNGVDYLRHETRLPHPLAQRDVIGRLATARASFVAETAGGWYDIGRGMQGISAEIVRIDPSGISYDETGLAERWRPAPHVVLDPRVQAGAPCLEGTRVCTVTVAAMLEAEPAELVARDLDVSVEEVLAVAAFEAELIEGLGITV